MLLTAMHGTAARVSVFPITTAKCVVQQECLMKCVREARDTDGNASMTRRPKQRAGQKLRNFVFKVYLFASLDYTQRGIDRQVPPSAGSLRKQPQTSADTSPRAHTHPAISLLFPSHWQGAGPAGKQLAPKQPRITSRSPVPSATTPVPGLREVKDPTA